MLTVLALAVATTQPPIIVSVHAAPTVPLELVKDSCPIVSHSDIKPDATWTRLTQ